MQGKKRLSNLKNLAGNEGLKNQRFNEENSHFLKKHGELEAFGRLEGAEYNRNNVDQNHFHPQKRIVCNFVSWRAAGWLYNESSGHDTGG